MKKLFALLLLVSLLLAACADDTAAQAQPSEPAQTPGKEYPYDYTDPAIFQVENFPRYLPEANTVGPMNGAAYKFPGTEDGFTGAQAATCDGTYGYFALLNKTVIIDGEVTEGCRIRKVDLATCAKKNNLDAIHDTVHEMARDEARHGKALEGLLNRYFR